nr:fibrinogen alpha chain-like [Drosophila bipectinata]
MKTVDPCPERQTKNIEFHGEMFAFYRDIREIQIPGTDPFKVLCCTYGNYGSKWMKVFYRRGSSKLFNRTYEDYERGFGNVGINGTDEFFIGLKQLHLLMNENPHELMVTTMENVFQRRTCNHFVVGSQNEGYMLKSIGKCTGNANMLFPRQGSTFSTFDRDEDGFPDRNLAEEVGFGWWFDPSMSNIRDYVGLYIHMYIRKID